MKAMGLDRRYVIAMRGGTLLAGMLPARAATVASFGVLQGQTLVAPVLGFAVTFPAGYRIELNEDNVTGSVISGKMALRFDAVQLNSSQSLREYMASGWIAGVGPSTIESFLIHGISAVRAVARNEGWTFRVFLIRFGPAVYRLVFSTPALTPQLDHAFGASADSFRRLTDAEIARATAR